MGTNSEVCQMSRCALASCIILAFLCVASVVVAVVFIIMEERPVQVPKQDDDVVSVGEPVFLSPLVDEGKLTEAKQQSRVTQLAGFNDEIYAGFITIDKKYNSNLYFIYFPARVNADNATVILWMNGGPGNPSIFCMTECSGPFLVNEKLQMTANKFSWTDKYSVIYVDQPVGTGFSFTDNDTAMATNQNDIADGMYSFLHQFFLIFPLNRNDIYILGQSYAGKYVPAVARKIHTQNPSAGLKINLKGLAIASGFCDPESMIQKFGDYAYINGFMTEKERDYFNSRIDETVQLIREKNFSAAMTVFDETYLGTGIYTNQTPSYYNNKTRIPHYYDIRKTSPPNDVLKFSNFVNQSSIRRAFHVGNRSFSDGDSVYIKMSVGFLDTAKPWYEELLQNYTILFYNGQFDPLISVVMTESFIWGLNWTHSAEYKVAENEFWFTNAGDKNPAGTVRRGGNLYQAVVRDAGHMVNGDQRERSFVLVQRFIEGRLL
ncbi:probable serine carboxypeptidase CPVL isoform X2 [Gigantopelta aegis]|nr:probable serine carboxypeptidase CPVL isoform X2 [Gigantopelta aegis]XP_041367312.1 probable serine carboxypeptidase CPVL isoform X2 [Gigantopelta aegis]XP_041367313.1 probable serine carboxypeptidase CPVL isoform X2 [Gigantopelta aegis]